MSEGGRRLTRSEMRERGLLKPLEEGEASPVEELRRTRDIPVVRATRRRAILAERAEAAEEVEATAQPAVATPDPGAVLDAGTVSVPDPVPSPAPTGERISVFDRFEADTQARIGEDDHSLVPPLTPSAPAAAPEPALEAEAAPEFSEGGSLRERLLARTQNDALRASGAQGDAAPEVEEAGNDAAAALSPASVSAAQPDLHATDPLTPEPLAHEYVDEDELEDESSPRRWTVTMLLLIAVSVVLGLVIGFFFLQHGAQAASFEYVTPGIIPDIKEIL
ncbi:hypothetical protein QP431_03755 [Actinotignum sanguinis]|uniref:hypothetical protein n=1 Tax=Actinotignum sanguinis TaxID=1445614 RepID=UPI00254C74C0|nr:hypothetical protein [Actinotignum sanguinis]MDK7197319.1 hypothetical protein [Actinotignum sanguinis]